MTFYHSRPSGPAITGSQPDERVLHQKHCVLGLLKLLWEELGVATAVATAHRQGRGDFGVAGGSTAAAVATVY